MAQNKQVIDTKPENKDVSGVTQIYTDTRTFTAGQWIPLAGLTYPTAGTVTGERR